MNRRLKKNSLKIFLFILCCLIVFFNLKKSCHAETEIILARLKYNGGGDWYNDPSLIPNLSREIKKRTNIKVSLKEKVISIEDEDLFSYPFLFATGHGNIKFSDNEIKRLRIYLTNGGFFYIDDDYGMDKYFRREIRKLFPDKELVEVPFSHPIYHLVYDFSAGLPKIHKHYSGPPKGLGIYDRGRLVVFYTYNTNISDGWVSPEVYNDPPSVREKAFKMGINIIVYSLLY